MKKMSLVLMILVLIVLLFVSACSQPAPTGTTKPASTAPASNAVAPAKVIELKISSHKPPSSAPLAAVQDWMKKIETASSGRIKFTLYSASSLVAANDILSATQTGQCDIGDTVISTFASQYPLTTLLNLPYLGLDKNTGYQIWTQLMKDFPELAKEYNSFHYLYFQTNDGIMLHTTKKLVKSVQDIQGMKLMAEGTNGQTVQAMGGSPVALQLPDWYSSLQKGILEGIYLHYYGIYETKVYELTPFHTDIQSGIQLGTEAFIMSNDTWNKLPPDIQKIFNDNSQFLTQQIWTNIDDRVATARKAMTDRGDTFYKATPSDIQAWYNSAKPMHDKIVKDLDAKGLPASKVYADIISLRDKLMGQK